MIDIETYGPISPGSTVGAETNETTKSVEHILQDMNKALRALNIHIRMMRR